MLFRKNIISILLPVAILAGCSPESQDSGTPSKSVEAIAIDPELAYAVVYADYNGNGKLEAHEPRALTDADGYIGYNPNSQINYCDLASSNHCLKVIDSDTSIVVSGGYDKASNTENNTSLSFNYKGESFIAISPLSTLDLGNQFDLSNNFTALNSNSDYEQLSTALKLHKPFAVISDKLNKHFTQYGDNPELPADLGHLVYQAAKTLIKSNPAALEDLLNANSEIITKIWHNSIKLARQEYAQISIENTQTDIEELANSDFLENVASLNQAIDSLITPEHAEFIPGTIKIVQKISEQTDMNPQRVRDNIKSLTDDPSKLILKSLSTPLANIDALDRNDWTTLTEENTILPESSQLPDIAGMSILIKDSDDDSSGAVALYFNADSTLKACVNYTDHTDPNNSMNTSGTILDGSWAQQGLNQLLLTLDFGAGPMSMRLFRLSGSEYKFDFDNNKGIWNSDFEFELSDAPNNDLECAERLR